ncbi:MAG: ABC transporter permease subunit [Chloroflexi bacterium]|nr:ABC transporter permease subunit [Chloroflexota bacterium]
MAVAAHERRTGPSWLIDLAVLTAVAVVIYAVILLASTSRDVLVGERPISLSPKDLPLYASLSLGRMLAAYLLSLLFTLGYGYVAAYNPHARRVMIPLLDVLQSIPLLSFLPIFVLSFIALFNGHRIGVELAAILLIFTSQVWNLTFSFYHSLLRIPRQLHEANRSFHVEGWLRFRYLELPAATIGLVWNSMLSWANGWFFLMASEMFILGDRSFQLPGLGSYLQTAANRSDISAILYGVFTLIVLIVLLDRLVWQPLVIWSQRFKLQEMGPLEESAPFLAGLVSRSQTLRWLNKRILTPLSERLDARFAPKTDEEVPRDRRTAVMTKQGLRYGATFAVLGAIVFGTVKGASMLAGLDGSDGLALLTDSGASLARVAAAQAIALAWTLPVGVAIGMSRQRARIFQPLIQITASIPATALFPILLLLLLDLPAGVEIAAIVLLVMAAQWYLLFNIIAGLSAIPEELKQTANLYSIRGLTLWRSLILPSIMPNLLTGLVVSTAASWNATIVAEYFRFGGEAESTVGLGSRIALASAAGDMPVLLASTLTMVVIVLCVNRFLWKPLQETSATHYVQETA